MLTYIYKCSCGKKIEKDFSIKSYPSEIDCECGQKAKLSLFDNMNLNKEKVIFFSPGSSVISQRFK